MPGPASRYASAIAAGSPAASGALSPVAAPPAPPPFTPPTPTPPAPTPPANPMSFGDWKTSFNSWMGQRPAVPTSGTGWDAWKSSMDSWAAARPAWGAAPGATDTLPQWPGRPGGGNAVFDPVRPIGSSPPPPMGGMRPSRRGSIVGREFGRPQRLGNGMFVR